MSETSVVSTPAGEVVSFDGRPVRMVRRGDKPAWLLSDLCRAAGLKPHSHNGSFTIYAKMLADYEKTCPTRDEATTLWELGQNPAFISAPQVLEGASRSASQKTGGTSRKSGWWTLQHASLVFESGVYVLYSTGRKALTPGTPAYAFRRKVFEEIIPTILRTGTYTTTPLEEDEAFLKHPILLPDSRVGRYEDLLEAPGFLDVFETLKILRRRSTVGFPAGVGELMIYLENHGVLRPQVIDGQTYRLPIGKFAGGSWFNIRSYPHQESGTTRLTLDFSNRAIDATLTLMEKDGYIRPPKPVELPAAPVIIPGRLASRVFRRPMPAVEPLVRTEGHIEFDDPNNVQSIRFKDGR